MKKLLLIPAALVLSTGFAFADGWLGGGSAHGLSLSQTANVTQSIGDTSGGSRAINRATVIQAQVPISFGTW